MSTSVLGLETACWLVAANADVPRLPGQPWALTDAVVHLARRVDDAGPLGPATRPLRQCPRQADQLTQTAVWALVAAGRMSQAGSGWYAGHELSRKERNDAACLLRSLPLVEQRAVAAAAHRLVATTTIWSKKPVAERPVRTATV